MEIAAASDYIKVLSVKGLFGRFNHELQFSEGQQIAIITAPNGYGKTVLLRIISSIFNRRFYYFWRLDFKEILLVFRSGKSISVHKDGGGLFERDSITEPSSVIVTASGFGDEIETFTVAPRLESSELRFFERVFPVERIGPDRWMDMQTDQTLSTEEILELYADQLPDHMSKVIKYPDWLLRATGSIKVHLVETQRLLSLEDHEDRRYPPRRGRSAPSSVVEKDARDLAQRIGSVLQQYANESQKLDQTFPKRIIEFHKGPVGEESDIRRKLQELTEKRDNFVSVGLIGSTISEAIRPSSVLQEESVRRILSIYIDDTSKKLGIFDEIYEKIRLFKQIIDDHFSYKVISIDSGEGIRVLDKDTTKPVPLPALSSGEQHELVLIYELLFKVEDGSLILIDEPELSLHVAWQKRFISNLQKIQNLKKIAVIIATHSPQIINDRWDLVQELRN